MREITEKLHQKVLDEFHPLAEDLAKQGYDANQIVSVFKKQLVLKTEQYYHNKKKPEGIGKILIQALKNLYPDAKTADSKAETIFYEMLVNSKLDFKFQYSIGPYRADYLFGGFLVVELDGPDHQKDHDDKRDQYMRRMGYKIIRVPIWILVSDPNAVIYEIKDVLKTKTGKVTKLN